MIQIEVEFWILLKADEHYFQLIEVNLGLFWGRGKGGDLASIILQYIYKTFLYDDYVPIWDGKQDFTDQVFNIQFCFVYGCF